MKRLVGWLDGQKIHKTHVSFVVVAPEYNTIFNWTGMRFLVFIVNKIYDTVTMNTPAERGRVKEIGYMNSSVFSSQPNLSLNNLQTL